MAPATKKKEQYSTRNLALHSIPRSSGHNRPSSTVASSMPPSSRYDPRPSGRQDSSNRSSGNGSSSSSSTKVKHNATSSKERLDEYQSSMGKTSSRVLSEITDPEDAQLIQYLAWQAYHLPGNTWSQDWWQFMVNNHPVFGICCHHSRHPIKARTRIVALIGTLVVGLAMTNMFYLFYIWNPHLNQPAMSVTISDDTEWVLTTGMLLLWTVGGSMHAAYNLVQWYIAACACCRAGGGCERKACCPSLGKHLLRVLVLTIVVLAVLIILMRVAISNGKEENDAAAAATSTAATESQNESQVAPINATDIPVSDGSGGGLHFFTDDDVHLDSGLHSGQAQEFQFLLGYLVESVLALFVYYPLGGTLLFGGWLGCCGRVPILGGRPYEVAAEERRERKRDLRLASTTNTTTSEPSDSEAVPVNHYRNDGDDYYDDDDDDDAEC